MWVHVRRKPGTIAHQTSATGLHWKLRGTWSVGECDTQSTSAWDELRQRYVLYTRNRTGSNREVRRFEALAGTIDGDADQPWGNESIVLRADAVDKAVHPQMPDGKKGMQDPLDYCAATPLVMPPTRDADGRWRCAQTAGAS